MVDRHRKEVSDKERETLRSEANQTGLVLLLLGKGKGVGLRPHLLSSVKSPAGVGQRKSKQEVRPALPAPHSSGDTKL